MAKKCISTDKAPQAIGPYSQATVVETGKLIFCSGQIAIDPESNKLVDGGVAAQTDRVLQNLEAVLIAAGSKFENVVKTTVFLKNIDDFEEMNRVYNRYFAEYRPARATVEVARLPRDVDVEIEAIAYVD